MVSGRDPTVVRSVAVTASDVVTAVEANRTTDRDTVLRLTPPFSGRMRARLHVVTSGEYEAEPRPVHVDPESLLASDGPAFPRPAETEDAIRRDPDLDYDLDRHHDWHTRAVAEWREAAAGSIVDSVTVDLPAGRHEVAVTVLGAGTDTD